MGTVTKVSASALSHLRWTRARGISVAIRSRYELCGVAAMGKNK